MKKRKTLPLLLAAVLLLCAVFAVPTAGAEGEKPTLADYDGKRIGILTGTIHDQYAAEYFPKASLSYFSSVSDMAIAVSSGTIDAFSMDILTVQSLIAENPDLTYIDEAMDYIPTAYAFAKTEHGVALRDEMNAFLAEMEADGSLRELQDKWLLPGAGDYATDLSDLAGNKTTLVFATSCAGKPNSYYYNNEVTGYEVELAALFCRARGYDLKIEVTDFGGILPGINTGKYDFGADGIAVTAERLKSVNFSDATFSAPVVLVIKDRGAVKSNSASSLAALNRADAKFGTVTGAAYESAYENSVPKGQLLYFNTLSDMIYALTEGQIDGFLMDTPVAMYLARTNNDLSYIDEPVLPEYEYGVAFGDTDFDAQLQSEFNEFLAGIKADGTLDEMIDQWYNGEGEASVSIPTEGKNGTVRVAVNALNPPVIYLENGAYAGLEADLLARFCTARGYAMEMDDMDFAAVLPAIASGRDNIGAAFFARLPERLETVRFSDCYTVSGNLMVVRAEVQKGNLWSRLAASFEKTFVREDRWKLILQGIGTTLYISVCAAALGTILGFGICMLRRTKAPVLRAVTGAYIRILQGTPLVVLLMILFYVVFAKAGLSGEMVAIIGFALNFAAYTSEIMRSGIDAIPVGQTEAALAIGYTKPQAFFRIVMPQAALQFLPVYKGEFISLVKMTSIVGYIAVQDLTKMSDIIRSRTYEAFFPLIVTAILYFLLSSLLTGLLRAVEIKIEPKRSSRMLKGVDLK